MRKIYGFFLIFLFLGCVAKEYKRDTEYKKNEKIDTLETVLNTLQREKRLDAIIDLYEQRKKDFMTPEQLHYVISAYFNKKQYASIIKIMTERQDILKMSSNLDMYWAKILGISYYEIGNLMQAQRFLEMAWNNSFSEEVSIYLSLVYLKKGQYSMAIMATSKLSDDKKDFVQALIYMNMKNWQKALQLLENIKDRNMKAYAFTAYCHYMMGNLNQAEKIVNDERLKEDFLSNTIKAIILIEKGYVKKGLFILEDLLEKSDENSHYLDAMKYNLDIVYEFYLDKQKIVRDHN